MVQQSNTSTSSKNVQIISNTKEIDSAMITKYACEKHVYCVEGDWLRILKVELVALGIIDEISEMSYTLDEYVYLARKDTITFDNVKEKHITGWYAIRLDLRPVLLDKIHAEVSLVCDRYYTEKLEVAQ